MIEKLIVNMTSNPLFSMAACLKKKAELKKTGKKIKRYN